MSPWSSRVPAKRGASRCDTIRAMLGAHEDHESLLQEVVMLRQRVSELQRAAARHEDTDEVSLSEREELLREAERVAHLGTFTWDVQSGRVTWSDELFRILGLEPGSIVPSPQAFFAALHPDDRERLVAVTARYARDGIVGAPEKCRVIRPDGSERQTRTSAVTLHDASGQVRRMVGGVLDCTESMQVEAKLRRTLALLEEAQRFAKLGSWRMDPTGEFEWSQEFRRIAGIAPDAKPSSELFMNALLPEDRPRFAATQLACTTNLQASEIDGRLQRPDGQIRHVRVAGFPQTNPDGSVEFRGTMLDVTDQIRAREELVQVQKMEAVGRLAGGIAHDFNNLLTVLVANLELLAARIGSAPEIDESLQTVGSAAALTRRLLAFGRKAQLSLKRVAPNALVRSMAALMQRLVGDEVRLDVDLAEDLPEVRVDPLEIERALVNLVVNARDAMSGRGTIFVATRAREVDGSLRVEFSIGDEGPGIDRKSVV